MIKRIETRTDKQKKDRQKQFILSGILVLLMVGSVFGIVVNSFGTTTLQPELTYNGFIFLNDGELYSTQVGSSRYYFSENPKNTDSLKSEVSLIKNIFDYTNESVYISSVDYSLFSEIGRNLESNSLSVEEACIESEECRDETLPKKTCLDNMIILKYSEENRIYESSNCVYIEGKERDLLKLTDEFLLRLIGIK